MVKTLNYMFDVAEIYKNTATYMEYFYDICRK